jgi:PAS domain S-box-containing protein
MQPPPSASPAPKSLGREQQEAELDLKERALAASAEGITIADARLPGNPLIYVNAGFEKLTGYAASDVLGLNCQFLQGPSTEPASVEALRQAIHEKRDITMQLLNYRKDGTPFWNRLSITPVRDASGAVTHFIGVQSDVTAEIRAREELEEANRKLEAAGQAIREDLNAAAEVQRSLLPIELPVAAGYDFAYQFRPSQNVGGDSLDVFPLDASHIGLYILDVSGHGVASALLAVSLSHILSAAPDRSFLHQPDPQSPGSYVITPPAEVVSRLNRYFLARGRTGKHFTIIYGILAKESGELRYTAAGQFGPVHHPNGLPPRVLETGGMPVGLLPQAQYQEHTMTLRPGDRLVLSTDGIIDAANAGRQEYGLHRLLESLQEYRTLPIRQSLQAVLRSVERWSEPAGPADDATLLALERTA